MATMQFYVTIDGAKQGPFKGEGSSAATKSKIVGLAFTYGVTSPRDPATGLPTGKRQHAPVAFVKAWGAATPQIFQACTTNEMLKSVIFEFIETMPDGKEAVAYTIMLTNAAVSAVTLDIPGPPAVPAGTTQKLQEVSLTFQKIEISSLLGKTSTVDDWTGAA
jgi:type VI secretion system secreted protein Hcp